jgi:hypothetical protein
MTTHESHDKRITENIDEAFRFIEKIVDDPTILDQIPEGARVRVVPRHRARLHALHPRSWRLRRTRSIAVGDQIIYVSDPVRRHERTAR